MQDGAGEKSPALLFWRTFGAHHSGTHQHEHTQARSGKGRNPLYIKAYESKRKHTQMKIIDMAES